LHGENVNEHAQVVQGRLRRGRTAAAQLL